MVQVRERGHFQPEEMAVLCHIHGGAFFANFSQSPQTVHFLIIPIQINVHTKN